MLEWFMELDRQVFIGINGTGSPYFDSFMLWMSDRLIWIPLYLYLIFRLYRHYGRSCFIPLLAILMLIICTDQLTSSFMKPYFARLRPCKDPLLAEFIMRIGDCRGSYGFSSGHAANAFAIAGFFFFLEKSSLSKLLIFWAVLIAYSRIYLGVHYPGDVLTGIGIGMFLSFVTIKLLFLFFPAFKAYSPV